MQVITTILYSIWLARNSKVFNQKDIPVSAAIDQALKILHDYQHNVCTTRRDSTSSQTSQVRNNKWWSLPPRNFLKLNVDAHLKDDGHWGLGLILLRDGVGAATKVYNGSNDVGMAEAMGLREALILIESMNLTRVVIELDAKMIVHAVRVFPRNQWGQLARACSRDFDQDEQISLT
ncbi:hypothetical protein A2U01_0010910 [Trifolium medium]|uniref:RNase H type-1 domain-containing protein n=1 Tax=Trifolium medium TaxID=97028 RepID=A0A392MUM5_9FABA|nr:hypothetical protein [Trifolium medium]